MSELGEEFLYLADAAAAAAAAETPTTAAKRRSFTTPGSSLYLKKKKDRRASAVGRVTSPRFVDAYGGKYQHVSDQRTMLLPTRPTQQAFRYAARRGTGRGALPKIGQEIDLVEPKSTTLYTAKVVSTYLYRDARSGFVLLENIVEEGPLHLHRDITAGDAQDDDDEGDDFPTENDDD